MEATLYKADYSVITENGTEELIEPYFFYAYNNDEAYKEAKHYESQGVNYVDIGYKPIKLEQIAIVDEETEILEEKEIIYY